MRTKIGVLRFILFEYLNNNKKNIRFNSFRFALKASRERNHKILVETGTSRGKKKYLFFWNLKHNTTSGYSIKKRLVTRMIYLWQTNGLEMQF